MPRQQLPNLCVAGDLFDLMEIMSWGILSIFLFCFLSYLIPFIGPSTMILSGTIAAIYPSNPPLFVGIAVAAGASVAKTVMYFVSYFAGRTLSGESMDRLKRYGNRIGRWKSFAVFLASATPIPDEPVLVSLALVRYSPLRFLQVFFLGKLVVTIPGAYLGHTAGSTLCELVGDIPAAIMSVIFTVIITVVLLKVDLDKLWSKWTRKKARSSFTAAMMINLLFILLLL